MIPIATLNDIAALCADALREYSDAPELLRAPLQAAVARLSDTQWTALVSGLCSVGKSSFVCALWGDSELLPTAVRDCTQTNTLIRRPASNEQDRQIRLSYLTREKAVDFASRDLSYYRLSELLQDRGVALSGMVEELPPEERIRQTVLLVKKLFHDRPDILVLHEPLTEELDKLEQFLGFIDSPEYHPGEMAGAAWDQRRELLMGRRHPDGRTFDTGKLLSFKHVELVRETKQWADAIPKGGAGTDDVGPPSLIDSPWIPTFHNARRADLIVDQAHAADILVIVALPQKFELEPWVHQTYRKHPELAKRTVVVFNQVDTIDTAALFTRDGFAQAFEENRERLRKEGILPENLLMSCARLPFLEKLPPDAMVTERIERLKKVLARVSKAGDGRAENDFVRKLKRACDPADAGVKALSEHLRSMAGGAVRQAKAMTALKALDALLDHADAEKARPFRGRAMGFEMALRMKK